MQAMTSQEALVYLRRAAGLDQTQAARVLGVSPGLLNRREAGSRGVPNECLSALAQLTNHALVLVGGGRWLVTEQDRSGAGVRYYGEVPSDQPIDFSLGKGCDLVAQDFFEGAWDPGCVVIRVATDGLQTARLFEGDYVLVDTARTPMLHGLVLVTWRGSSRIMRVAPGDVGNLLVVGFDPQTAEADTASLREVVVHGVVVGRLRMVPLA